MRTLALLALFALTAHAPARRPQAGPEAGEAVVDHAPEVPARRRVSRFDELRDGGFGVGSAAPVADGAQPMDHPVKAWRSTMTFLDEGDAGYGTSEPELWFYDAGAAERAGFHHAG